MANKPAASQKKPRKKAPPAKPGGQPRPIDAHVGARLKLRRSLVGLSQEKLGDKVGLTFQQIQKYERGANRIGASRLYEFSRILDVPVAFFFDDISDDVVEQASPAETTVTVLDFAGDDEDPLSRKETLELVRSYYRIEDPNVRKRIYELVKSVSIGAEEH